MTSKERKEAAGAGFGPGERVAFSNERFGLEGILMPKSDFTDPHCIVLKLDSGYNIGLDARGAKMRKLADAKKNGPIGRKAEGTDMKAPTMHREPHGHRERAPIHLLTTGGTIASKVDYTTGAVHPTLGAGELVETYPELKRMAPISAKSVLSVPSEEMMPEQWTVMAREAANALKDGAAGVVIAHGTDTMGYSAAALSYALPDPPGPVVFTGAQRSPDRGSSDAAQNLFCSAAAARADFAAVTVCMHANSSDEFNHLHWGTRVRKSHTSGRWAFRSVGVPPMGKVMADSGQVLIDDALVSKREAGRKLDLKAKFSSNAHLAWIYPGIQAKVVESWADFDGVLLAGTGLGHVPMGALDPKAKNSLYKALDGLVRSGVVVAVAPQAMGGRVILETYSTGRLMENIGIIGHGADWTVETAYVKMCWALGQEKDAKKIRKILLTPLANDITPYSQITDEIA
ncbi:MAG: Glu-tRNA(Gln) amidotransferase subunit GatD [Candidatus Micrarchaeota archaeon]